MINRQTRIGRAALTLASAGLLALGGAGIAQAQDPTPTSSRSSISAVGILNPDGLQIGTVIGSEFDGAVTLTITVSNLAAGEHGMHIHETGACDPEGEEPFSSAGGHFNPTGSPHGPGMATVEVQVQEPEEGAATPAADAATPMASADAGAESHAGDLGNITVDDTGRISVAVTATSVTFAAGPETSLADANGSALVIHQDPDDLTTDPSGNSGGRIACSVLFAPASGPPAASPEA
ncbi:MAG: superoxide dismutase family protein [Chloroflexota bacterium]|nr:superoxide dismutase family protein [Chloroflexota bacterium]